MRFSVIVSIVGLMAIPAKSSAFDNDLNPNHVVEKVKQRRDDPFNKGHDHARRHHPYSQPTPLPYQNVARRSHAEHEEALRQHLALEDSEIAPTSAIKRRQEARSAAPPAHTLIPAQPPNLDLHHLDRLFPVLDGTHHYTPNGHPLDYATASFFANANITYQNPTVILPHSNLISYTKCVPGGFEIGFSRSKSKEAFDYVRKAWVIAPNSALTLVSASLECDSAKPGEHSYWNVTALAFDPRTLSVTATAVEVELKHAYQAVKLQWGSTNPSNEINGGEGASFSGAPGKQFVSESKTAVRKREISKREAEEGKIELAGKRDVVDTAQLVPFYAKVAATNFTTLPYTTARSAPVYYLTPPSGSVYTSTQKFALLAVASTTLSNDTGYLVAGYRNMSMIPVSGQSYYTFTTPQQQIVPGYALNPMFPGSCPEKLIAYVYQEQPSAVAIPTLSTRTAFSVSAWAAAHGLGNPIAISFINVVDGTPASTCTIITLSTGTVSSSASSGSSTSTFSTFASSSSTTFPSSSASSTTSKATTTTTSSGPSPSNSSTTTKSSSSVSSTTMSTTKSSISSSASSAKSSGSMSTSAKSTSSSSSPVFHLVPTTLSGRSTTKISSSTSSSVSSATRNATLTVTANSTSITASPAPPFVTTIPNLCLSPPAQVSGLLTSQCGPDFDTTLDAKIGFLNFTLNPDSSFASFIPGIDIESLGPKGRRSLFKRHWWDVVGDAFVSAGETVGNGLVEGAEYLYNGAVDVVTHVVEVLDSFGKTVAQEAEAFAAGTVALANSIAKALTQGYTEGGSHTFDVNIGPGSQVDSPWGQGDAYVIYAANNTYTPEDPDEVPQAFKADIGVYCVDCGVTGSITLGGDITFTIIPPDISQAEVYFSGSLKAGVNIGVDAHLQYTKTKSRNLFTAGVPEAGISIADLFTIGAIITVDAVISFDMEAEVAILVGADMDIASFSADLKIVGGVSTSSGFTPTFSSVFNATAGVEASLGLALPIEFGVGLAIPAIDFDKEIGLRNTPTLTGTAAIEYSNTVQVACPGLAWSIDFKDVLAVDLVSNLINLYTYKKAGLFSGCVDIPGLSHGSGGAPILTYTPPVVTTTSSKAPGYTPPPVTITTTTQSNAQPPTVTALHLAGDSPLTHGSVEYAKFQSWGIDISIIPPKYPTSIPIYWNSQMSDAQCLTLCQRTAGCKYVAWIDHTGSPGYTGQTPICYPIPEIVPGSSALQSVVFDTTRTCDQLLSSGAITQDGYSHCYQYFPDPDPDTVIEPFAVSSQSPNDIGSSIEWSIWNRPFQIAGSSGPFVTTGLSSQSSLLLCGEYCTLLYPGSAAGANWLGSSANGCVCTSAVDGNLHPWELGFPLSIVGDFVDVAVTARSSLVFQPCSAGGVYTVTEFNTVYCQRYFPYAAGQEPGTNMYALASDSPAASGPVEWAEFGSEQPGVSGLPSAITQCSSSACCTTACYNQDPTNYGTVWNMNNDQGCRCLPKGFYFSYFDQPYINNQHSGVVTSLFMTCDDWSRQTYYTFYCQRYYPFVAVAGSKRSLGYEVRQIADNSTISGNVTQSSNVTSGADITALLDGTASGLGSITVGKTSVAIAAAVQNATTAAAQMAQDYVNIYDLTMTYAMVPDKNGNLYITQASKVPSPQFYQSKNVVCGNGGTSVLYYYPDEMAAFGVSRFRYNDFDHIPVSAQLISLMPINYDKSPSTAGVYIAVDTSRRTFYTMTCIVATTSGYDSKIFLVKDPKMGVSILTNPDLQYVITGGPLGNCSQLALASSGFAGYS